MNSIDFNVQALLPLIAEQIMPHTEQVSFTFVCVAMHCCVVAAWMMR